MDILFRVEILELEEGKFKAGEHILDEMDMYKLLQRLGARKMGIMELKIERLSVEQTEAYLAKQAKYR